MRYFSDFSVKFHENQNVTTHCMTTVAGNEWPVFCGSHSNFKFFLVWSFWNCRLWWLLNYIFLLLLRCEGEALRFQLCSLEGIKLVAEDVRVIKTYVQHQSDYIHEDSHCWKDSENFIEFYFSCMNLNFFSYVGDRQWSWCANYIWGLWSRTLYREYWIFISLNHWLLAICCKITCAVGANNVWKSSGNFIWYRNGKHNDSSEIINQFYIFIGVAILLTYDLFLPITVENKLI